MTHTPRISIVMPVYNAAAYLAESIESILSQTYSDFEFIIIDDKSKDASVAIIKQYAQQDKRIIFLQNKKNAGVAYTLNRGVKRAQGHYLARMDADDIAHSTRLEKQLAYLEKHTDVVGVGTQCYLIDKKGKTIGKKLFPMSFEEVYPYTFKYVPVQHPTLMVAMHKLPKDITLYNDALHAVEDLDLYFKLFTYGKVVNMPEFLLKYRIHDTNVTFQNIKQVFMNATAVRMNAVFVYGYRPTLLNVLYTIAQSVAIGILPEPVILRLFMYVRNARHAKLSPVDVWQKVVVPAFANK